MNTFQEPQAAPKEGTTPDRVQRRVVPSSYGEKPSTASSGRAAAMSTVSPLLERRAQAIERKCQRAGLARIERLTEGMAPEHPVYCTEPDGWSMIIVPSALDPTRTRTGRLPVPTDVLERLHHAKEVGIQFDRVYVGHELHGQPLGASGKRVSEKEVSTHVPSPPATATAKRIDKTLETLWRWTQKAGRAAGATLAAGAGLVAGLTPLDPIVFGVLVDDPSKPAIWFAVDSWEW